METTFNPDRILYPLKRVGKKGEGKFERVDWEVALSDVASRLKKVIHDDGAPSILPYSFAGTEGMVQGSSILDGLFFARLGASRLERNICGNAGAIGISATIGTSASMVPDDIVHSRYIIIWGANTIVTNQHLWPFIEEARNKGAKLVVIDPLKSRTAAKADLHIQPLPGTDAALALGMMHLIIKENLHDKAYIEKCTLGFDSLLKRLEEYPPERVAEITGLELSEIIKLSREYATTPPAVIRTMIGMEHHTNGGMMFRTIACLPAIVGAWREQGGGLLNFTWSFFGECLNYQDSDLLQRVEDKSIRSINMVQLGKALHDLDPPIKALIVYNSNPAVIAPNQQLVLDGLKEAVSKV